MIQRYYNQAKDSYVASKKKFIVNGEREPNIHQEKLEAILANAVDAIITINEVGIVESVNPAMESLFGYSADEVVGQNIKVLMPMPDRGNHDQYLANYLATGVKKIIGIGREVRGLRKDGSTFPLHLAVSEIQLDGKRLFTGICRDISDQKRLVQNERLAAIGQMMAGLAHESRNALQKSHACLTNLAFDVREMPESLELIEKVQNSLDHLNGLLDEVRDYAAPIVLEKSPTNIASLIRETWQQLIDANPDSANIEFNIESAEAVPAQIKIDRYRIGQVIWNLLENARVACGESESKILVRLGFSSEGLMMVSVSDNGAGIPEENLDSIFQPFFTTKTKGTGLGLAICQRIVEAHSGTLSVTNKETGGACFTVTLPTA